VVWRAACNWSGGGAFTDDDNALFDNTAPPAANTVTITETVNPAKVTVNNANYIFVGSGSISNAFNAALYKTGSGTLTIANSTANTYSGATNVQGGMLNVDLSNLATPTNLISSNSALAMSGSALVVTSAATGASSQTFNGATFSAGDSSVKVNNTAAGMGNSTTLALGALSRSAGTTVNFSSFANDSITTTTGNNTAGIIGGWATFNNNDWATASGAGPAYTIESYSAYTADTWASGNNTDVTEDSIQGQDSTTNSLRFNSSSNATVSLSSANGSTYNTIQSGGILVGSGNIANQGVSNYVITGGNLTSGGSELMVNQRGSAALTIDSTIVDRGANLISLTKSGPGLLLLSGANTYTGGTMVNAGTLAVKNTSGSGTGYGDVNVLFGS
jgi:fibronectin-binding autotransporter adhesin